MDKSSQRELLPVGEACSIPEVMEDLAQALSGNGAALGFGKLESTHVPEGIAVVIGTSGSTGKPKQVGLSSSALLASARASHTFLAAEFGHIWSLLLPMTHIAAVNVLVRSLELGTIPLDLRSAKEFPQADFTAIVPTQLFRALNGDTQLLKHLCNARAVLVGGAALPEAIRTKSHALGINVVSTYGMTETSGGCVYDGKSLPGVDVAISENGRIKIKGSTLATTYLGNQEAWASSLSDEWFVTNDIGSFIDGKLFVEGRADDIIISGGEKISLDVVESILHSNFPDSEFAAFSIADAEWGSSLQIAIASAQSVSTQEITRVLANTLGDVAKPKGFLMLSSLPTIGIGKIDRKALTQRKLQEGSHS